jgi:hypothetical protein
LTTSNGEVTIAPAIPPTLVHQHDEPMISIPRVTHLPAAECFHPDNDFFCGGDDVDGGTSEAGDAAGILEDVEGAGDVDVEAFEEPGSQADEKEIG